MSELSSGLTYSEIMDCGGRVVGIHKVRDIVHKRVKTKFQTLQIYDLELSGKTLVLDGVTQSCEKDEYQYHEMLVHPAMFFHPEPKSIFIGGGGEGATAREVIRHTSVEKCLMVDIDGECVEICKKYLPSFHKGVFDNKKLELVIDDAVAQLQKAKDGEFDVIVLDLADPREGGPCYYLYCDEFYEMCCRKLSKDGVLVTQATNSDLHDAKLCFTKITNTLKRVFKTAIPYQQRVDSWFADWGFVVALKNDKNKDLLNSTSVIDELIEKRIHGGSNTLKLYEGQAHKKAFILSKTLRKYVQDETFVIQKDNFAYFQ